MDKEDVEHTYNEILLSLKKNKINNAICSNMDRPRGYYNVKSDKERQISYDITYMWI